MYVSKLNDSNTHHVQRLAVVDKFASRLSSPNLSHEIHLRDVIGPVNDGERSKFVCFLTWV